MPCQVVSHPLAAEHLARLRNASTTPAAFRQHLRQLATMLSIEGTRDLPVRSFTFHTPLCEMQGQSLAVSIGIVPILRAGLGMVEPLLDFIPNAQVWHLGLYRDEATALPVEYYQKLPPQKPVDVAFVVDPMLATGGSATAALTALRNWGVRDLRLLSIIGAAPGVERVEREFPDVRITLCAIDPHLNDRKFIVPGLGDAGDRTFNTL